MEGMIPEAVKEELDYSEHKTSQHAASYNNDYPKVQSVTTYLPS